LPPHPVRVFCGLCCPLTRKSVSARPTAARQAEFPQLYVRRAAARALRDKKPSNAADAWCSLDVFWAVAQAMQRETQRVADVQNRMGRDTEALKKKCAELTAKQKTFKARAAAVKTFARKLADVQRECDELHAENEVLRALLRECAP
jgi:hypothetical protein